MRQKRLKEPCVIWLTVKSFPGLLAEESTLRRWRKEFGYQMQQWAGALESKVFALSGRVPRILEVFTHPFKRLEKVLSQLPPLPSQWTILIKTLWWLQPSYPL
jgi:hypothetical protein